MTPADHYDARRTTDGPQPPTLRRQPLHGTRVPAWSEDGTVRPGGYAAPKDARLLAYTVSQSGSDWQAIDVLDLATRKPLADKVEWVRVFWRRLARQRLLLQPLSCAGEGQGAVVDQREPPGLLPPGRHAEAYADSVQPRFINERR